MPRPSESSASLPRAAQAAARPATPAASTAEAPATVDWKAAFETLAHLHESERHAVARALHDRIGQAFSAIGMSAHLTLTEPDPEARAEDLRQIMHVASASASELRELHSRLRPPQLDSIGLVAALHSELERLTAGRRLRLEVSLAALPHPPAPDTSLAVLRIAQQLLQDALGHEALTMLRLELAAAGHSLELRLAHDGKMAPAAEAPDLLSLVRARASACGGSVEQRLQPGQSLCVLRVPYAANGEMPVAGPLP